MGTALALLIIAIVILLVIGVSATKKNKQKTSEALQAYQASLAELSKRPTDATLRTNTLALGREYSNLMRSADGTSFYDEMALKNDIEAATATVANLPQARDGSVDALPGRGSPADRIRSLDDLWSQGLITEDEYATQRARILDDI